MKIKEKLRGWGVGGEKRGRFRIERVIGLAKIEVVGVGGGQQKGCVV